jgi:hypothetical protein
MKIEKHGKHFEFALTEHEVDRLRIVLDRFTEIEGSPAFAHERRLSRALLNRLDRAIALLGKPQRFLREDHDE